MHLKLLQPISCCCFPLISSSSKNRSSFIIIFFFRNDLISWSNPKLYFQIHINLPHNQRSVLERTRDEDHDGLELPNPDLLSSLRQLSGREGRLSGRLLPHRPDSGGGASGLEASLRRNFGTYFAGDVAAAAAAAAAAAGAAVTGSRGRELGATSGRAGASPDLALPKRLSFLSLSFSSNSRSLCLCFSAISSNLALRSASSFFLLSASAKVQKMSSPKTNYISTHF